MPLTLWQAAAQRFDTSHRVRKWPTPGAMAMDLDPLTRQTAALDRIDQALVNLADGRIRRLMILMPPQEGKSERTSRRFVEWVLHDQPNTRAAIVSFSGDKALRWGKAIKADITSNPELGLRLRADTKAAGRWAIAGYRGGVYCTGVGGSLTGEPVDLLVIDDPIADLEEALSPVYRERARRFWQGTAVPRLGPNSRVVLIQTRWHEDDLAGWLLKHNPQEWTVLSIPAIAESNDDPLGRAAGEAMRSARGARDWTGIKREVGDYAWAALYQQRPAPSEGGLFKRAKIRHWVEGVPDPLMGRVLQLGSQRTVLQESWKFLTVDLAASTKTHADFTVIGVWAIAPGGELILLDGARARVQPDGHWPLVQSLRERHRADTVYVESRMFGTTLVYEAGRAGIPVVELEADTDKVTRALPATARADSGRLWFPSVETFPWVQDWVDELASFPNGAHDDVVDVTAYAARVAAANWMAPGATPAEEAARLHAVDDGLDLARAAW